MTTVQYQPGSDRVAGITRGASGEQQVWLDELGRTVMATDGHNGTWRGRYDTWGNLFEERLPSGAYELSYKLVAGPEFARHAIFEPQHVDEYPGYAPTYCGPNLTHPTNPGLDANL